MMKDKISQRLKRVSIKSIVWSHWNEGSRFQIKSRQCYQILQTVKSTLVIFFFGLQFLFDFFYLIIYLPFAFCSGLLYSYISFLPHFGRPLLFFPFMSVASATPAVYPFCSAQCWRNFKKQPKNRTSHLSEICWCVVGDVALSLLFFLTRVSFSRWAVVERNGRLPKERLVKKKQLQSESAAASSFFFSSSSSSSSSLVCIYNFHFFFFFLGYYGFPCIVKESVSVLVVLVLLLRIRWTHGGAGGCERSARGPGPMADEGPQVLE